MRMGYLNLFRQLVPAFTFADLRPDPPRTRLRAGLDALEEGVHPRRDHRAVDVVTPDVLSHADEVPGDRVAQAPVLAAELCELRRVHAGVVVRDVVLAVEG